MLQYNGSIKVSDNGKINKANPVTLFNVLFQSLFLMKR